MADQDIQQAIKIIDDKIASLKAARDQLARAFGIESHAPIAKLIPPIAPVPIGMTPPPAANGHEPTGRKVELAKFLASHGPTSRATIIEKSGLPEGTISYCLNDKRFFQQVEDGNWAITEYSKRGLERGAKNGMLFQGETQ